MSDTQRQTRIRQAIERHPDWTDRRIANSITMPRGQTVGVGEVQHERRGLQSDDLKKAFPSLDACQHSDTGIPAPAPTAKLVGKLDEVRMRMIDDSKFDAMKRKIRELERDRSEMLSEYNDIINARPVARAPSPSGVSGIDTVRAIFGDVHGMRQDKDAVAALMRDMSALQPDEVVIVGDMIDCGGFLAKHQTLGFVAECDYSYQEDIAAANDFLDRLQAAAPKAVIHFIMGNHDDRVEKWCVDQVMANGRDAAFLVSLFGPVALMRLEERNIQVYKRDKIYGEGLPRGWMRLGKMFFTHDLGYSVNAARCAVLKSGGNVTFGHSHRWDTSSIVLLSVGICAAFNPGCLCLMQPMYMHSRPTDWTQGYDIDFVAPSGNFLRTHVPIWRGESLAGAMIERFKS